MNPGDLVVAKGSGPLFRSYDENANDEISEFTSGDLALVLATWDGGWCSWLLVIVQDRIGWTVEGVWKEAT